MEKDLYFEVLKTLSEKGIFNNINISFVFHDAFLTPNKEEGDLIGYNGRLDRIIELLNEMELNKHIIYKDYSKNTEWSEEERVKWIKPISIYAKITTLGFVFYREHKQIVKSNKYSKIALAISFAAALFTGWPIFKNPDDKQEGKQESHAINRQKGQSYSNTTKKYPTSYPLDSSRK